MTKTEHRIIAALRKCPSTIAELCEALDLSRNAIVFQLGQMETKGLVERGPVRHAKRAGKPAVVYQAVEGREDSMSNAYRDFSAALVGEVSGQLSPAAMKQLMKKVGKRIAQSAQVDKTQSIAERLSAARAIVDELGAATELHEEKGVYIIQSHSCPLASAVRSDGCVCGVVAGFFKEATGCLVEEQCRRGDRLVCRFRLSAKA